MESRPQLNRCPNLIRRLAEQGLGAMLITSEHNRRYLSGFSGSNGWLVVSPDHRLLITDGRYWTQVGDQAPEWELFRFTSEAHQRLSLALAQWLKEHPLEGPIGYEADHLTCLEFSRLETDLAGCELKAVSGVVEGLRAVKDQLELEAMRATAAAADRAFATALQTFQVGVRERDFCAELEYQMQREGARKPSFDSIVASGPNGAYPHAGVTDRVIGPGELVTVDFGAYLDGYASDITRTIWVGEPDDLSRRVYAVVRQAQRLALEGVRAGRTAAELDQLARGYIEKEGFGEAFMHSLGHGIGLAVHESPTLRSTVDTVLEEGMVVTIEPGVYLAGKTGCRVEDTVEITADGCRFVTGSPYQELGQLHPLEAFT
ncbi:MAG: M24 family metallopeptidase [Vulcanimicrobiota bacterium]